MNDTDGIRRLMMAVERLEDAADKQARQMADGLQQAQQLNAGLATIREAEEAKLKQAMVRLFQDQQQKTEAALRPVVGRAWLGLVTGAVGFGVLYVGLLLLIHHEYQRLKDAQVRADAADVSAEVLQASRHVEITSCGGRPCILVDRDTPTWKSRGKEYVLVNGKPVM